MKLWQGLIACASIGVAAYLVHAHRAEESELAQMREDIGSLSHALGEARRDAARNKAQAAPVRPVVPDFAPPASPEEAPSAQAEAAPTSSPTAPAAAIEPVEVQARLDAKFTDERSDAAWAVTSQRLVTTKLSAVLPPASELRSVECRASMCKIESRHEDAVRYRQFAQSAFSDPETEAWNAGFFSTATLEPGSSRVIAVAYVAREGQELPPIQ